MAEAPQLDIDVRDKFERDWNWVEKFFFTVFILLIIAGLTGVLGDGPVGRQVVTMPGTPVQVTYDHFVRDRGQTQMIVEIKQPIPTDMLWLGFDQHFLDRGKINGSIPLAFETQASADGVQYAFKLGPDHRGRIVLTVEPQGIGPARGAISYGASKITLQQLVLP